MVKDDHSGLFERLGSRVSIEAAAFAVLMVLVGASAIAVKESRAVLRPLVAIDPATDAELSSDALPAVGAPELAVGDPVDDGQVDAAEVLASAREAPAAPGVVRWFNGRPVRQVRAVQMIVTAYSPDDRSCPGSADGITATLHSVATNGMALVAADPRILPYGSMLTIPGYDDGNIVPVLDCGGAIKDHRLDLLFPTHEAARQWGRKTLRVIVWEYADGGLPENPRHER